MQSKMRGNKMKRDQFRGRSEALEARDRAHCAGDSGQALREWNPHSESPSGFCLSLNPCAGSQIPMPVSVSPKSYSTPNGHGWGCDGVRAHNRKDYTNKNKKRRRRRRTGVQKQRGPLRGRCYKFGTAGENNLVHKVFA